jgi:hypothetical protein
MSIKKSSQLLTIARAELNQAEKTLGAPGTLLPLRKAVKSLSGLISGDFPQIEKDIAKNLLLAFRTKVLSEVKLFLANLDSSKAESVDHWDKIMEVFMDAGLDNDPEFNRCKEQLLTKRDLQSIHQLSPAELEALEKELRATLESLSAHRSRLSNIKWPVRR